MMASAEDNANWILDVMNLEICPRCHEYVRGLVTSETWQCPKCRAMRTWAVLEQDLTTRQRSQKYHQVRHRSDTRPRSWGINTAPPAYPKKRRRMKKAHYLRVLQRFSFTTEAQRMGHKFLF